MNCDDLEAFKESIFEYDDYRAYLKDYFTFRKKLWKHFTQRYFAQKAGFNSHAFCNYVMNGKRNLSSNTIERFISAMELDSNMAEYFETLVYFNQESDQNSKKLYFQKLEKILMQKQFYSLNGSQAKFYSSWYFAVLRELVVETNWGGNYNKLTSFMYPKITVAETKEAVEFIKNNTYDI